MRGREGGREEERHRHGEGGGRAVDEVDPIPQTGGRDQAQTPQEMAAMAEAGCARGVKGGERGQVQAPQATEISWPDLLVMALDPGRFLHFRAGEPEKGGC